MTLVALVKRGYTYWFFKTTTGLGERGEEDCYGANQRFLS
jgi:hypothetical protein